MCGLGNVMCFQKSLAKLETNFDIATEATKKNATGVYTDSETTNGGIMSITTNPIKSSHATLSHILPVPVDDPPI